MSSATAMPQDLAGYETIVGVSGGIAAYKVCYVVSALVQRGAGVTCVMTRAATRFVGPLTFEALTGRPVLRSLWRPQYSYDPQHISAAEAADAVLIAPASADLIARLAHGLGDDLLTTLMLAVTAPVLLAPAMNQAMWKNPIVQANLTRLREAGYRTIGPADGWQACRSVGPGRLEEPLAIIEAFAALLTQTPPRKAAGKKD